MILHFLGDYVTPVLPIVAGALFSIKKTMTPQAKHTNLLLLQHRLESEKVEYRGRARIIRFRAHPVNNRIRQDSVKSVNCIYENFIKSTESEDITISETPTHSWTGFLKLCLTRVLDSLQ